MLDDLRSHDPKPTRQECAWMQANPFRVALRVMALTVLAVIIASALTTFNSPKAPAAVVAAR
jgi:hypothetical protein